jgi:glycosyltransferase involved in cell wall biosynthesis
LLALPRGAFLAQLPRVKLYHAQFANEAATTALVAAYLADRYFSFRSHTSPNPPLLRQKLRRARLVVAISDYDRAYLLGQEPNAHVEVARLGVDILDSSEAVCHPGLIVSVGSLIDKKGHDLLIEAVRRLRERALDVSLTIIGAGPEGDRLMRQIRSAGLDGVVHLTGHLPRSETLELMANAEVCALASRPSRLTGQDGVPVALMEALACGKACVSTRVSGIPELVIDGETGLLVPPDDPSRLASALESLLTDEEARERLGQAGRRLIADRYDAFTNYGRLAGLLEQAAR